VQRPVSRLLALAGSIFLGLAGAVALATPASAHHTTITGEATCVSGKWQIVWEIENSEKDKTATISKVTANPNTAVTRDDTKVALQSTTILPGATVTATQEIEGNIKQATLKIDALWEANDKTATNQGSAVFVPAGESCTKEVVCVSAQDADYKHTFDGPKGTATISVDGDPLCAGQQQDFLLVSYFAPSKEFALPQYVFDHQIGTLSATRATVTLDVKLPPCWTQVDLVWGGNSELIDPLDGSKYYGDKKLGSPKAPGNRSTGPKGWYNGAGTEGVKCTQPQSTYVPACDGSVTVHLSNSGKYTSEFVVTAGEFKKNASVAAGKAADIVVPAGAGAIKVTADGKDVGSYAWTQPEDCPPPTVGVTASCDTVTISVTNPVGNQPITAVATYGTQEKPVAVAAGKTGVVTFPTGSSTQAKVVIGSLDLSLNVTYPTPADCGWLPTTGAKVTGVAAAGALLVGAGAAIFFLSRRRRLNLADME
jgi:LPXTG-motif cell wall-anchored protein